MRWQSQAAFRLVPACAPMSRGGMAVSGRRCCVDHVLCARFGSAIVVLMFTSQETLNGNAPSVLGRGDPSRGAGLGRGALNYAWRLRRIWTPHRDGPMAQPHGRCGQEEVQLETGTFAISVSDAQARFDLTDLGRRAASCNSKSLRGWYLLDCPTGALDSTTEFSRRRPHTRVCPRRSESFWTRRRVR